MWRGMSFIGRRFILLDGEVFTIQAAELPKIDDLDRLRCRILGVYASGIHKRIFMGKI